MREYVDMKCQRLHYHRVCCRVHWYIDVCACLAEWFSVTIFRVIKEKRKIFQFSEI